MFRKGLYAGSTALGLCGIWAYCAEKGSRRVVYDMTEDHIESLQNRSDLQLKFVQVFFRHGARTPLSVPNYLKRVEWKNETLYSGAEHTHIDYELRSLTDGPAPESKIEKAYRSHPPLPGGAFIGQLTAIGMEHCYKLGQRLRQHYQYKLHFLPKTFNHQDFYFRSTNIVRTIESLRCVVAGMCSPLKDSIKIYVALEPQEVLYPNTHHCPLLRRFHKALYENADHVPGMKAHRIEMQQLLGLSEDDHLDFINVRDIVRAREAHGRYLPQVVLSRLDFIDQQAVAFMKYAMAGTTTSEMDRDVLQMNGGNIMHLITSNLEDAANSQCKNKMHLYSCHDTSLIPALLALDIFPDRWPEWAADLIIELYQDKKGKSYVRTLYLGEEVHIRGSKEGLVPLEKFKETIKPFSLKFEEFEHLCQLPKSSKASVQKKKSSSFF